jgi:hypothetical protein
MKGNTQEPITTLIGEFFDSTALNGSFLGQIAKSLITKTMNKYVETNRKENFPSTEMGNVFNRLSKKWSRQILQDLSKLDMNESEKKLLLALSVAKLIGRIITPDRTPLEIDIAGE